MAGIDKTYTKLYSEYKTYKKWAEDDQKFFNLYKYRLSEHFYDLKESDFTGDELPICNMPFYADIYLIRNCPIEFVQNWLKIQYASEYNNIKTYTSEYDTFKRNGLGNKIHYTIKYGNLGKHHNRCYLRKYWYIYCNTPRWWYNQYTDEWLNYLELKPAYSNVAAIKTLKSLTRKLKKWNLPAKISFTIYGRYVGEIIYITTK